MVYTTVNSEQGHFSLLPSFSSSQALITELNSVRRKIGASSVEETGTLEITVPLVFANVLHPPHPSSVSMCDCLTWMLKQMLSAGVLIWILQLDNGD